MIPKEILKQVKHIEIRTTRLVNSLFGGEYESVFKGQGIEFADVREYVPGDDIRTIDWNVTARSQHPFVKKFAETRELSVLFVVDVSNSTYFGSQPKWKSEIAAEICALLAFSAVKNNDKVGLLTYSKEVEKYLPVKKGRQHVLRVIREILYYQPEHRETDLRMALEYLHRVMTRRAIIFIISDFFDAGYEKPLKILNQKHDLIAITITDPREMTLPYMGYVQMEDAETGDRLLVDTRSNRFRKKFADLANERKERLDSTLKRIGIDRIAISTNESYAEPIMKFFMTREKRFR